MDCVPAYKNVEEEFHYKEKVKSTLEVPNVLAEDDPVAEVAGPVELSLSDEEDILVERLQELKLEEQMLTRKQRIADLRRAVTEKEKRINVLSHRVQAEQAATLQDTKWQQCVADPSSVPARRLTCKDLKKLAGKSIECIPLDRLLGAASVEQSSELGHHFPPEVNFGFGNKLYVDADPDEQQAGIT